MPEATNELAMSRIGVAIVDGICARATQVWRETPHTDVGLDGQIEFKDGERATGIFLGVQVKTGPSYIAKDGYTFVLKGDKEHFAYWGTCAMPVIGVVVDPVSEIAMWVDLTATCSPERTKHGPYAVPIPFTDANAFTIAAVSGPLKVLATNYSHQRVTRWQLDALEEDEATTEAAPRGDADAAGERLAWNMLCADFGSPALSPDEIASVGQRLAWHLPKAPDPFKAQLQDTLKGFSDGQLARAIGAARVAIDDDRPDVAELVADLLSMVPEAPNRIRSLLERATLPHDDRDAAIQTLELWEGESLEELRDRFLA